MEWNFDIVMNPLLRYELQIGKRTLSVIHLHQKECGIQVKSEGGYHVLVDGGDSAEMVLLASICKYLSDTNDIFLLERENELFADLLLFNGASNPVTKKDVKQIKNAIKHNKGHELSLEIFTSDTDTRWEWWKYEKQISVKAEQHVVLAHASKMGLELLARQSLRLATTYLGHIHCDVWSTSSSTDLIIRNMARND
jgi:hypothetical protein